MHSHTSATDVPEEPLPEHYSELAARVRPAFPALHVPQSRALDLFPDLSFSTYLPRSALHCSSCALLASA